MATRTSVQRSNSQRQALDESLAKLKQQYSEELQSLKTLFADWSEQDLLTTLDEVQGDLDLAIGRISEGHAQQWGEVTKKKEKVKTAKVAAEAPSSNERAPRGSRQGGDFESRPRGDGFSGRGGRGGGRGGRGGGRGGAVNGSFHPRPPRTNGYAQRQNAEPLVETKSEVAPTDTWGAPAVEEVAPASNDDWGTAPVDDWGAVASTTVDDSWGTEVEPPAKPVVSQTTKSEAKEPVKPTPAPLRPGDGSKTSWAQLVKGLEPVPPVPAPVTAPAAAPKTEAKHPIGSGKPSSSQQTNAPAIREEQPAARGPSPTRSPARAPSPAKERVSAPASPTKSLRAASPAPVSPIQKPVARPASPAKAPVSAASPQPTAAPAPAQIQRQTPESAQEPQSKSAAGPPGLKQTRAPVARKLKQDAAVVMPSNATLSSIGVQFGSLKLGSSDDEEVSAEPAASAPTHTNPISAKSAYQEASQPSVAPAVSSSSAQYSQLPHYQQQQQYQQHYQQVQQQQAQQGGLNQRASTGPHIPSASQGGYQNKAEGLPLGVPTGAPATAGAGLPNVPPYGNYFPGQQLPASGFGMGHLGNVPGDYSALYGTDAQARAAVMGYYDPAAYQAASKYQAAEGHSLPASTQAAQPSPQPSQHQQQAHAQAPQQQQQQTQQQQQAQQQGYPMPYAYYPYYMPNQFPSQYQQSSVYGQPFVNKSVYPYAQQTQQPSTIPGTAPKTSAISGAGGYGYSSAQQPHLYQQGAAYDDLATGLGAQDYKSASSTYGGIPQQSFQNFGLNSVQQPGTQAAQKTGASQTSQVGGQQGDYKSQQQTNRPRPGYDTHKYQAGASSAQGGQGNATSGTNVGTGAQTGAQNTNGQGVSSYYNQHQMAGLHPQQQLGYMQQQQQHYQSGNLYNQSQRPGQGYWNGQS